LKLTQTKQFVDRDKINTMIDALRNGSFDSFALAEFSAVTARYIAARRAEWIAAFGDQLRAAATNEVCQRIILPRCQPVTGQPT
jgi:hypothetical protein